MLRWAIIGFGLLSLIGAVVLLFVVHTALSLGVYLALDGLILVGAILLERKRYRARVDRTRGSWQSTGERFVDPATGRFMEVFYNPTTGERDYREVATQTQASDR